MAEYLKLFENHTDYEAYISDNPTTPNVSYCSDVRDVHYNPAIINFASSWLKQQLLTLGIDRNNDGEIDIYEAAAYKGGFGGIFDYSSTDFSFDEFRFFTGMTSIPNDFVQCEGLTSIVIPDSITYIGRERFSGCTSLTSVTIPDSVTEIRIGAFIECTSLTNITIPDSVTLIEDAAFDACTSLVSVTVEATTPPELREDAFHSNASGRKIYVPAASVNAYKAAEGWSDYASDIMAIPTVASE